MLGSVQSSACDEKGLWALLLHPQSLGSSEGAEGPFQGQVGAQGVKCVPACIPVARDGGSAAEKKGRGQPPACNTSGLLGPRTMQVLTPSLTSYRLT